MISLDAANCIAREDEHFTEFELHSFAASLNNASTAGRSNIVSFFDHAVNGESRISLQAFIFDLGVESILAFESFVAMKYPYNIVW